VAKDIGWDEAICTSSIFVVEDIIKNASELVAAFSKAKVLLACSGPYRICGLPILKAAIEAKCDYLDLCGEPQFFDDALIAFDRKARDAGVLAVHAAAFDCIPSELGSNLAERELLKNDSNEDSIQCAGIEIIHTMQNVSSANATTFHAAVDGFYAASSGELKASRKKVKDSFPEFEQTKPPKRPDNWPMVCDTPGIMPGYNDVLDLRTMKFVGADASAIRSSWRYLRSRSTNHPRKGTAVAEPRLSVLIGIDGSNSTTALKVMAYGGMFSTLARFKFGCNLLHSYPETFSNGVFTSKGPTEDELKEGSFTTYVTAYGSHHSETNPQLARVKVSGPEPGYVATPRLIVALALTILDDGKKEGNEVNLSFEGGCTLPGALFCDCDKVYDNMRNEGVSFDVVNQFTTDDQSPV